MFDSALKLPPFILLLALLTGPVFGASTPGTRIVLIAGKTSPYKPKREEYRDGCLLLQKCLAGFPGVTVQIYNLDWPTMEKDGATVDDDAALDGAAAIVIFGNGEKYHPLLAGHRLATMGKLMKQGVGLGLMHWAVEPTAEKGEKEFIEWEGGAFEDNWSIQASWKAEFKTLPDHPVTRGVKPFTNSDEWYFHLRFRAGMQGVTPILMAVPPLTTIRKPGPRSGNPTATAEINAGTPQTVMWVSEREGGGRGFGITGYHLKGWQDDNERKLLLNSILWIAHVEVPPDGVQSQVSPDAIGY